MAESFTKEEIEKACENLLWAHGIINYVFRIGGGMKEAETLSIFQRPGYAAGRCRKHF
jgi:hypothetical protein